MSALLLAKLRKRGIRVGRVGDQLEVMGPASVLTAEAVAHIRAHKAELLAALSGPATASYPTWPPGAVREAVEARALVLSEAGLSVVGAERQAAEEILRLDGMRAHEAARCDLHGCLQRTLPHLDLYRCPACVPGRFAQRSR